MTQVRETSADCGPSTGYTAMVTETKMIDLHRQVDSLNHQFEILKAELNETGDKLDRVSFSWKQMKKNETNVRFYAVLPSGKI